MVILRTEPQSDIVYIRRIKTLNLPFNFYTVHQTTKDTTLLDSRVTENFINKTIWKELQIGCFKLNKLLTISNVDRMENKQGKIEHYCWLKVYF